MNYEKQKLELIERERAGEEISFEYLILESKGTNLSLKKMEEIEEEWRKRGLRITRSQNENKFSRVGFENDLFDLERVDLLEQLSNYLLIGKIRLEEEALLLESEEIYKKMKKMCQDTKSAIFLSADSCKEEEKEEFLKLEKLWRKTELRLERVNERFFVEKERIEGEKEQIG